MRYCRPSRRGRTARLTCEQLRLRDVHICCRACTSFVVAGQLGVHCGGDTYCGIIRLRGLYGVALAVWRCVGYMACKPMKLPSGHCAAFCRPKRRRGRGPTAGRAHRSRQPVSCRIQCRWLGGRRHGATSVCPLCMHSSAQATLCPQPRTDQSWHSALIGSPPSHGHARPAGLRPMRPYVHQHLGAPRSPLLPAPDGRSLVTTSSAVFSASCTACTHLVHIFAPPCRPLQFPVPSSTRCVR